LPSHSGYQGGAAKQVDSAAVQGGLRLAGVRLEKVAHLSEFVILSPLAGAKNLVVAARQHRSNSEMLRFAQHDSPPGVCQESLALPRNGTRQFCCNESRPHTV
jgi:hypothetical protein